LDLIAYYRRNVTDEESIRNFETSVTRASAINNAILIIGGDMNFPGWNWKENTLKPNSTAPNLHTDFMDVLNNNALIKLVEEPTRQQNTLDLILTNHPGKVIRTDTIAGISDHDIVYTEVDLRPVKLQQKPRTIPLYNKANLSFSIQSCRSCYARLYFSISHTELSVLARLSISVNVSILQDSCKILIYSRFCF
jgi:hypothetical protein